MIQRPPKWPNIPYYHKSPSLPDNAFVMTDYREFINPHKKRNKTIYITEKLDGLNVCLYDGEIYLRDMNSHPAHADYLAMMYKHHAWRTKGNDYAVWGEDLFAVHAIRYAPMPENMTFRAFGSAIFRKGNEQNPWLHTQLSLRQTIPSKLGLPVVPILFHGSVESEDQLDMIIQHYMSQPSALGGEREGIIVREDSTCSWDLVPKSMFKVVRKNHVQPDAEHWSKNWERCELLPAVELEVPKAHTGFINQ